MFDPTTIYSIWVAEVVTVVVPVCINSPSVSSNAVASSQLLKLPITNTL